MFQTTNYRIQARVVHPLLIQLVPQYYCYWPGTVGHFNVTHEHFLKKISIILALFWQKTSTALSMLKAVL